MRYQFLFRCNLLLKPTSIKELLLFGSCIEIWDLYIRRSSWRNSDHFCTQNATKYNFITWRHDVMGFARPASRTLAASLLKFFKTFNHSFRSLIQYYVWNHISDVKVRGWQFLASKLHSCYLPVWREYKWIQIFTNFSFRVQLFCSLVFMLSTCLVKFYFYSRQVKLSTIRTFFKRIIK